MELSTFLERINKQHDLFEKHAVFCFNGSSYPLLFFSFLFSHVRKQHPELIKTIDLSMTKKSVVKAQLQTPFLGERVLYWLRSFPDCNRTDQRDWLSYIQQYQGPNAIVFFLTGAAPKKTPAQWLQIEVPEQINNKFFLALVLFLYGTHSARAQSFARDLFARHKTIPLDTACLLAHYATLTGKNTQVFFEQWLDNILMPESSLFSLSQHFFAKQDRRFFAQWARMHEQYVPQFWISFWSEQLWRASMFAHLAQAGKYAEAKKIGFRLPFSFLRGDWKKHSVSELKNAHQFIYSIDYQLKHGGTAVSFDLFYNKFFLGQF